MAAPRRQKRRVRVRARARAGWAGLRDRRHLYIVLGGLGGKLMGGQVVGTGYTGDRDLYLYN